MSDTNAIPTGVWIRRELVDALRDALGASFAEMDPGTLRRMYGDVGTAAFAVVEAAPYLPPRPVPEEGIKCPTCGVARGWNTDGHLTRGIWTLNCSQCGSFQVEIEDTSVPAPHAEAEAAWSDWSDIEADGYDGNERRAFIAGYLRGRGDRG